MINSMRSCLLVFLWMLSCRAVCAQDPTNDTVIPEALAAKLAMMIYSPDHCDFRLPFEEAFTVEDLSTLPAHRLFIERLAYDALNRQHSIWAARLAARLHITNCIDLLRPRILDPQEPYGWEGPDYSNPESFLQDRQFMYATTYVEAIQELSGQTLRQTLALTAQEWDRLQALASNPASPFHHWATWLLRKLAQEGQP
jgi:hypothetical protein